MIIKTIIFFAAIVLFSIAIIWAAYFIARTQANRPLTTDSAVTLALSKCYEHSSGLTFPPEIRRECERLKEDFVEIQRVYRLLEQ